MKITLVRHGATEYNDQFRIQGQSNIPLNDHGRSVCKRLRNKTNLKEYDICFSSPLVRAMETAMILVGDRVKIITDKRLVERNMGDLEGKNRDYYDFKKYWNYNLNCSEQGIEPIQDIFKRCNSFLEDIYQKYPNKSILVVAHGAVIRSLHHILKKTNLNDNLLDIDIPNSYFEEIEIKEK